MKTNAEIVNGEELNQLLKLVETLVENNPEAKEKLRGIRQNIYVLPSTLETQLGKGILELLRLPTDVQVIRTTSGPKSVVGVFRTIQTILEETTTEYDPIELEVTPIIPS